jgi:hypothetical protein
VEVLTVVVQLVQLAVAVTNGINAWSAMLKVRAEKRAAEARAVPPAKPPAEGA